jgi:DNA repair protein RecO (recombination protein O)
LVVSFYGKSEILNLKKVEADGLCYNLSGTNLLLGFYLNELLVKLLHKDEAHQNIYSIYEKTLAEIATFQEDNFKQQLALRTFELELIKELGYGLELRFDALGKEIMPDLFYRYDFGIGFMPIKSSSDHSANTFSGSSLKALSAHALSNITEFREIKRLMQHIIAVLLNGKTIKTREIFRKDVYCATSID